MRNFFSDISLKTESTLTLLFLFVALSTPAHSQIIKSGEALPQGAVIYSLPKTYITLKVKVARTTFTPGPYASYAQKYLGVEAKSSSSQSYEVEEVVMQYGVEADPSVNIALNLGNSKNAGANFLSFSQYGLLVASGQSSETPYCSSTPQDVDESWKSSVQAVPNFVTKTTQLYKSVTNEEGEVERVAVPQTQTVRLTTEEKAQETAELIDRLRQKRIDILIGETDANYSGEALGAAAEWITKLEEQYVALFLGKKTIDYQIAEFTIVPEAQNAKQNYVAFRISDTEGLLPAENVSGRPVYLQLSSSKIEGGVSDSDIANSKGKIAYRIPVMSDIRIIDNQKVIGQARIPVYQFGKVLFLPADVAIGR